MRGFTCIYLYSPVWFIDLAAREGANGRENDAGVGCLGRNPHAIMPRRLVVASLKLTLLAALMLMVPITIITHAHPCFNPCLQSVINYNNIGRDKSSPRQCNNIPTSSQRIYVHNIHITQHIASRKKAKANKYI